LLAAGVARAELAIRESRRLQWLSVPPAAGRIVCTPGDAGPAERARVIVEKPFGTDLESGRKLKATVHEVFGEEQIPAIDHSDCGGANAGAGPPLRSPTQKKVGERMPERPILIAYDGSEDARSAITRAGELLTPGRALVVTVWPAAERLVTTSAGAATYAPIFGEIDELERTNARAATEQGAALARHVGFDASPLAARSDRSVWRAIPDLGAEHNAEPSSSARTAKASGRTCCWAASRAESSTTPIGPYSSFARTARAER
jgi:hypothetical protein